MLSQEDAQECGNTVHSPYIQINLLTEKRNLSQVEKRLLTLNLTTVTTVSSIQCPVFTPRGLVRVTSNGLPTCSPTQTCWIMTSHSLEINQRSFCRDFLSTSFLLLLFLIHILITKGP